MSNNSSYQNLSNTQISKAKEVAHKKQVNSDIECSISLLDQNQNSSPSDSSKFKTPNIMNERSVLKDGTLNSVHKNIRPQPFISDIFTTLVDIEWRFLILVFCIVYFGSWLIFACLWYGILYIHGDLDSENFNNTNWKPCIRDLKDFTTAFLFSVETQHTTGYGFYELTDECAATIVTFCIQSIVGCILEGIMVGLLFVKISRGKKRSLTILFSHNAIITRFEDSYAFMFRVADLRNKSNLLQGKIRAQVLTKENGIISRQEIELCTEGEKDNKLLLFWPTIVLHKISETSPFHKFLSSNKTSSSEKLTSSTDQNYFEVVVILEGVVEATGQLTQARTSYIWSEILHGFQFEPIMKCCDKGKKNYNVIDYNNFNATVKL